MDIAKDGIEGVTGDGVVATRTELAGDACVHNQLAGNLGSDDNTQSHPGGLESIAQRIEVPNREDGSNHREVGDGRGTWKDRLVSLITSSAFFHNAGPPALIALACCVSVRRQCGMVHTRVLPREELGEEGVIVSQRLAGGSWVGGSLTRGGEVRQLGAGLCMLLRDLLGNGTCGTGQSQFGEADREVDKD